MKLSWNATLQIVALFLQVVVPQIPGITADWTRFFAAVLAFVQGCSALIAQFYNPDGKPASEAYKK